VVDEHEAALAPQLAHNPLVKKNPVKQVVAMLEAVQALAPAGHLIQAAAAVPTVIKE
jgi:hypothetical protein